MKSETHGGNTLTIEVSNISPHGLWLLVDAQEYFVSFDEYPWFRNGTVAQIGNVCLLHGQHIHWPDLDVDLSLSILENPSRYPLIARESSTDTEATFTP